MSFYKRRVKPQPSPTGGSANATESGSTPPSVPSNTASSEIKSSLTPTPIPPSLHTSQQTLATSGLNIRLRTSTKDAWNPFAPRQAPAPLTPMVSSRLPSDVVAVESPAISASSQSAVSTIPPTIVAPSTAGTRSPLDQDAHPEIVAVTQVQPTVPQDSAAIRARRPGPLVLFHRCQAKNPVLGAITQVQRAEGRIACDYECSPRVGVVYVSARFHVQKPEYAPMRLGLMGRTQYMLKILLVLLDVELAQEPLMMLTLSALAHNHTVICASSTLEAARYLELLATLDERAREDSSAFQTLMGKVELGEGGLALELLKSVRGLTKNSILGALKEFKSFAGIATADVDELCNVHGMGQKRASKLHALMHEPFR